MNTLVGTLRNSDYDEIDDITVIPGGAALEWNDEHIENIRIYNVQRMASAEATRYGEFVLQSLRSNEGIDSDLVSVMLHLAVSLRDPEAHTRFLLKVPDTAEASKLPITLPGIEAVSQEMTEVERIALAALMKAGGEKLGDLSKEIENKDKTAGEGDASGSPSSDGQALVDPSIAIQSFPTQEEERGPIDIQAAAYSFLCAYLFRLQCRSASNTHVGLKNAAMRFAGWYDDKRGLLSKLGISSDALVKLKDAIARKPEVVGTWVMYLAVTDNETNLLQQQKGMLEYLGLQVFSYQGMHALTQVLAIHQISKMPLGELLRELDSPMTRDGLKEIVKILRNHEITTKSAGRKTYFRFARVWSPKYFMPLQSKICVPLLYVAAVTVKNISPNTTADPTQIFALQNMGSTLKATLDRVSHKLVGMIMSRTMSDAKSGSAWDQDGEDNE